MNQDMDINIIVNDIMAKHISVIKESALKSAQIKSLEGHIEELQKGQETSLKRIKSLESQNEELQKQVDAAERIISRENNVETIEE